VERGENSLTNALAGKRWIKILNRKRGGEVGGTLAEGKKGRIRVITIWLRRMRRGRWGRWLI
jgi:hypothetical protein